MTPTSTLSSRTLTSICLWLCNVGYVHSFICLFVIVDNVAELCDRFWSFVRWFVVRLCARWLRKLWTDWDGISRV